MSNNTVDMSQNKFNGFNQDVLLTGATGNVGGRLLRRLQELGLRPRCLARNPAYLRERGTGDLEVVQGDLLDPGTLHRALDGIDTA